MFLFYYVSYYLLFRWRSVRNFLVKVVRRKQKHVRNFIYVGIFKAIVLLKTVGFHMIFPEELTKELSKKIIVNILTQNYLLDFFDLAKFR
jgi:hypothetical protein